MIEPDAKSYDLAIVGGGPAGQAAAEQAVAAGLSVAMIDEQPRMGGQILRQPPEAFQVNRWLPGAAYRAVKAQLARAEALDNLAWLGGTSALGIFPAAEAGFVVALGGAHKGLLRANRVLIAAGCYDLPVALPGWTIPGVMSAGGVQAFLKSQQIAPGERFVLAGTHPLQLIVADQILQAGAEVAAVLFAQPLADVLSLVLGEPLTAARHASVFVAAGAALLNLQRAGIPVRFAATVSAVEGDSNVTGARTARIDPVRRTLTPDGVIACDRIALCFGFIPQTDLIRAAGCAVRWNSTTGGWRTSTDAWMRTSLSGLYAAGETTGVAGADIALEEGRIAGLGVAVDAGAISQPAAVQRASSSRRRLRQRARFARMLDALASPEAILPLLADDDTLICRCEDVSRRAIIAALTDRVAPAGPSAIKLLTRAGMGLCQGRSCEHAVLQLAAAKSGAQPETLVGFTSRFPARPIAISDLIG